MFPFRGSKGPAETVADASRCAVLRPGQKDGHSKQTGPVPPGLCHDQQPALPRHLCRRWGHDPVSALGQSETTQIGRVLVEDLARLILTGIVHL